MTDSVLIRHVKNEKNQEALLSRACAECKLAIWQRIAEQNRTEIRVYCGALHAIMEEPIVECSAQEKPKEEAQKSE